MDKWIVIVNPNAGKGRNDELLKQFFGLMDAHGIAYNKTITPTSLHASRSVAEAIGKGHSRFIVFGGDGTLNEVINGMYSQNAVDPSTLLLANMPVGTGNDWMKTHHLPADATSVIEMIKNGYTSRQDIGVVSYFKDGAQCTKYFLNVAGMGFDAYVTWKTNRRKEKFSRSKAAYLMTLLGSLIGYKPLHYKVFIDGALVADDKLFSLNAGICKYNGGGMMQVPHAIPDDGLLSVTLCKNISVLKVILNVKRLYNGTISQLNEVALYKGKSVEVFSEGNAFLETDGESLGHTPVTFSIIPGGLQFIAPVNQSSL